MGAINPNHLKIGEKKNCLQSTVYTDCLIVAPTLGTTPQLRAVKP